VIAMAFYRSRLPAANFALEPQMSPHGLGQYSPLRINEPTALKMRQHCGTALYGSIYAMFYFRRISTPVCFAQCIILT
jgi:hypothetical protein